MVALSAIISVAHAQTMNSSSSSYNSGYGRYIGQENQAYVPPGRDGSHNRVVVDGVIQNGNDHSALARSSTVGTNGVTGAGVQGGASAIGNNLQVVVQGNWNTVIVSSNQINNGNVTANTNNSVAAIRPQGRGTVVSASNSQNLSAAALAGLNTGTPATTAGVGSGEVLLNGRINLDQGPF